MIGIFVPMLPDNIKVILAIRGISAHMFYGFALYIISTPVYPLYPISQQAELGLALFAPSPIYLLGYLYLNLTRENKRIEREESGVMRVPSKEKRRIPLSKLLLVVLSDPDDCFARWLLLDYCRGNHPSCPFEWPQQ